MGKTFKDLIIYQKAFKLSMQIFEASKSFPVEERYSLTDQIRRSSRSVCTNLAEGYRKRRYQAYFLSKLSDSDMENSETQVWLDFAFSCGYLSSEQHKRFFQESSEVGRMLNHMIHNPEKFQ
ncbi:MAG: four helix bundle protein [Ignavibacteriaceae bacterium]|nr:four helix bundle protein [Ignavibacteriaceae bacterium]